MKSCSKYTEVFNIKNKTLLITIIFVVVLAVLYFAYKPPMFMYKPSFDNGNNNGNNNGNQSNQQINQHQPKNKINNLLNKGSNLLNDTLILSDKFADTPPIDYNDLTVNQQKIVDDHRTFFNGSTKDAITDFYNDNATNINENLAKLISNYNDYNNEVNTTIEEINYDLLRQLQRNYALAHKVNIKRNIELQDIDNLPQRFD
jgi:hypothetical protein